mmetsp:Transcript_15912/g.36374  ORF Transcript_15912/g.36374 Transcript_15912/m.36374 type:complete len:375 (-) Transcript_15912:79-1203(-)
MGVDAHEVAQPVRHEERGDLGCDDVIQRPLEVSVFEQMLGDGVLGKVVHVPPLDPRFHALHDPDSCIQNSLVDPFLDVVELSTDRKRACYIRCVTVVFVAHVIQNHLFCQQLAIVWSPGMAVMKNSCICTASTDSGIRRMSHPSIEITVVQEISFHLILHHIRLHFLHDSDVSFAAHTIGKLQDFKLIVCLGDASFKERWMKYITVAREGFDAIKMCGYPNRFAVRIDTIVEIYHGRRERCEEVFDLISVHDLVYFILGFEVFETCNTSHPDGILRRQPGNKQDALARVDHQSAEAVWLSDTEQVMKVRLLAKELLMVRIIPASRNSSGKKCNRPKDSTKLLHVLDDFIPRLFVKRPWDCKRVAALPVVGGARD